VWRLDTKKVLEVSQLEPLRKEFKTDSIRWLMKFNDQPRNRSLKPFSRVSVANDQHN
jgi:hypothetical protein